MTPNLTDIYSLTEFQRNAKEHLRRIKKSGRPVVLTVNGKAEAVVQDAASYQKLLDLIDHTEATAGIRRGLESVARGEGRPAKDALEAVRKKHKIAR